MSPLVADPGWLEQAAKAAEFLSLLDRELRLVYVNHPQPGAEGYRGKPVFDFVAPAYHEALRTCVERAWASGLPQHFTSEALGPDGEPSSYSNWITPCRLPSGDEVVAFIATDVTHPGRLRSALDLSETTLRALYENAPDHVAIIDRKRRIEHVNRTCFGRSLAEVAGLQAEKFVAPDDRQRFIDAVEATFENANPTVLELRARIDAEEHPVSAGLAPIRREGQVARLAVRFTDLSALRRAEREREHLLAELHQAQKMDALGQLTGGVAHDFNNLLMVIGGSVEAVRSPSLSAADRLALDEAMAAVDRAAALTRRLLAFSRKQALRPERSDVGSLVAGMTELLRRTLGETIELDVRREAEPLVCEIDRAELETAILNLAINARDAMPRGGKLTIDASAATRGDHRFVVVRVADTGTGMEPGVLARSVEPFFTTKGVGRGSGLGLSMVYGFVSQSGGELEIHSTAGEGTSVTLRLPRAGGEVEERGLAAIEVRGDSSVLVVEDDPNVRRLLASMVRGVGHRVVVAETSDEALAVLDRGHVELLVCDVVLPGPLGGVELVRRAKREHPELAALLISGYPREVVDVGAQLGPRIELLLKPFTRVTLAEAMQRALERGKDAAAVSRPATAQPS